jgi:hypothetical protein
VARALPDPVATRRPAMMLARQPGDGTMRIAFDLDRTLIPAPGSMMAVERLGVFARAVSRDSIRAGAPRLLGTLRDCGHEVWLYTTSYRSPLRLRLWFAAFGVRLDGIVNQARHEAVVGQRPCSKYPPAFGIDLLVDDSEGVVLEGARHGFGVLRIDELDAAWCSHVELAVREAAALS